MRKVIIIVIYLLMAVAQISCQQKSVHPNFMSKFEIKNEEGHYYLYINGVKTYILGVGSGYKLDIAAGFGANGYRTWGGDVSAVKKEIALAKANGMYLMQGINITKNAESYQSDTYKNEMRQKVKELAETFKDDSTLFAWGIGNEIEITGANNKAVWTFVDELAILIKSIDKRHLVSTVISHNEKALNFIGQYTTSLDFVGINSYGAISQVATMFENSKYKGPYMITEWGPTGYWETSKTTWEAPIEQNSEEKRIVYEEKYKNYILNSKKCLGSFVFIWGKKQERTPTWFSMFVEENVPGLPLKGEMTPTVEAMQRVWTGSEPAKTAPIVKKFTLNGKTAAENVTVNATTSFMAKIEAVDKEEVKLTYVYEILKEATVLGVGGSYEPRPDRVGNVVSTDENQFTFTLPEAGNYRIFVYIIDNKGFVGTANIPFQVL